MTEPASPLAPGLRLLIELVNIVNADGAPGASARANVEWLSQHAPEFVGRWRRLADDPNLVGLGRIVLEIQRLT